MVKHLETVPRRRATTEETLAAIYDAERGIVRCNTADLVILTLEDELRAARGMLYTMAEYLRGRPTIGADPVVVAERAENMAARIGDHIDN